MNYNRLSKSDRLIELKNAYKVLSGMHEIDYSHELALIEFEISMIEAALPSHQLTSKAVEIIVAYNGVK